MGITKKSLHVESRWIWLIVFIVLLDQGTKHLVVDSLETNRPMAILPSVDFVLSYNKGVSFSFLQFAADRQRWPLVGLSILASGLLYWWLSRVPPGKPILATGLSVILGGALGNVGPSPDRFSHRLCTSVLQSLVVRCVQFRRCGYHSGRHRHHSVILFGDAWRLSGQQR
jgi:lipoprotein signal peptidase